MTTCPRCAGPLNDPDLDFSMAGTSYISEDPTIICLACKKDETYRHLRDATYIPPTDWPITEGAHDYVVTSELDPDKK